VNEDEGDPPPQGSIDLAAAWLMRRARAGGVHIRIEIDIRPDGTLETKLVWPSSRKEGVAFHRATFALNENGTVRKVT
jgi:hypothetical protein